MTFYFPLKNNMKEHFYEQIENASEQFKNNSSLTHSL